MIRIAFKAAMIVAVGVVAWRAEARDAFDAVKCGGDVAGALTGKRLGPGTDDALEKKHASLGLKDEGGEIINDDLNYGSWTICGGSYHMLLKGDVVNSVVRADHSRSAPSFLGECKVDGKPVSIVFAILKPASPLVGHGTENDTTSIPADRAWRIDEKSAKFVETNATGMMCPRNGVATADGGE